MRRLVLGMAITFGTLAPTWARADDQQIALDIVQQLKAYQSQGQLRGFKIDLQVDQGTVLLTGRVADQDQQQLALAIAQQVEGVTQVVNDLEVISTAERAKSPARDDSPNRFALSNLARTKLLGSEEAAPVAPSAGKTIPMAAQVPVTPLVDDEQIAQQIYQRLQKHQESGELKGFHLDLRVEDGSVVLDGRVSTARQKSLTLDVARRVPGVYQVVDMIRVEKDSNGRNVVPVSNTHSVANPNNVPLPLQSAYANPLPAIPQGAYASQTQLSGQPVPMMAHHASTAGIAPVRYDHPNLPNYAWPSYAAYPNYAAVTYPRQYSASAWPYIGPFYPYPQVPLGWRKVALEWRDGWWQLDFCEK
jgi:osmotically-inducible protein OsmY